MTRVLALILGLTALVSFFTLTDVPTASAYTVESYGPWGAPCRITLFEEPRGWEPPAGSDRLIIWGYPGWNYKLPYIPEISHWDNRAMSVAVYGCRTLLYGNPRGFFDPNYWNHEWLASLGPGYDNWDQIADRGIGPPARLSFIYFRY